MVDLKTVPQAYNAVTLDGGTPGDTCGGHCQMSVGTSETAVTQSWVTSSWKWRPRTQPAPPQLQRYVTTAPRAQAPGLNLVPVPAYCQLRRGGAPRWHSRHLLSDPNALKFF